MSGYRPPSARMRQIKQARTQQVEAEARQAEQEAVDAAKEPQVEVKVGAMTATVSAGPDGELGTADDKVEIKPTPKPKPALKFDKSMTKEQLLKVAAKMKVKGISMKDTKANILKALKKAAQ